jgi:cytochrome c oxidase subunit 2
MVGMSRVRPLPPAVILGALALSACTGPQSALDPAGEDAAGIAALFWQMLAGAAVIWCLVLGGSVLASWHGRSLWQVSTALKVILWAGAVFPTVVLAGLLIHGLRLMPALRATESDLRIEVVGERFWWRVIYHRDGASPVASANEVRLPAGATVEFVLSSPDVIHSFWIPPLGGKTDMIPGRTTRLVLRPTRPGVYRGACAEFCGASHALMALTAEVMAPDEFASWLQAEAGPAAVTSGPGPDAFLRHGCAACHTVRGTEANAVVGPDLTHLGSRHTVGAGILANDPAAIARFIAHAETLKPELRMPSYAMLPEAELRTLADWLASLR